MRGATLRADLRLRRLLRGSDRILVGPFLSEVGYELLYWIPMLTRAWQEHGVDPARVVAVSRGGAGDWYRNLAGEYVDVLDHFGVDELHEWQERRIESAASQKQHLGPSGLDTEVLRRAGLEGLARLHPSLMYRRFWSYFMGRAALSDVVNRVRFARLPGPSAQPPDLVPGLPERYIAVKAYTSDTLPATDANREALVALLGRIAESVAVVDLSSDLNLDEHRGFRIEDGDNVFRLGHVGPAENLAAQTAVVAGAAALLSTYGGFSYLGPFIGVPSYAIHSEPAFNPVHLAAMERAAAALDCRFEPVAVGELGRVSDALETRAPASRSWEASHR
jgi:hypothetical protein